MVEITQEEIQKFIEGRDPQERIVNLVYHYKDDFMKVLYRNDKDQKCISKEPFYPFCWATRKACEALCNGNRSKVKELLAKYCIGIKKLNQTDRFGTERHEFDNGYLFMFYAKVPMSYTKFLNFFKECDNPIYGKRKPDGQMGDSNRQYMAINPQEQFMIATGKRFFKGYDDYNQLLKMTFDLESTGLNTKKDKIIQIGIKFNRPFYGHPDGFQKIINVTGETEEQRNKCELWAIEQFLKIIYTFKPDIITGHNSENFDWNLLIGACERLGTSLEELSAKYFEGEGIRKEERESILKLGGEIEKFNRTIVPGVIVTDSLHAVRRAQATDSNFKKADLKYSTKYLKLASKNRVYVPGGQIDSVEADLEEHYAFNNENGDWYLYEPTSGKEFKFSGSTKRNYIPVFNNIAEGYELVSGQYIVERYLYDDLSECEAVETALNGTDFMLTKFIPVTFSKCCTMGTAGQWKSLMMAFSYERGLAIPYAEDTGKFTGGLSRLLKVGFVKGIIKLDYNSLYPSIILTWGIEDVMDLLGITLKLLEFVLSTREIHKGLKKSAEKIKEKIEKMLAETAALLTPEELKEYEEARTVFKIEDNRQSVFKKLGNSFFGAYGSNKGAVYPWKSIKCAEQTTCTGRQSLRLMISHFSTLSTLRVFEKDGYYYAAHDAEDLGSEYNYEAIVGDSFTEDTPMFIKYKDSGKIAIIPISMLFNADKAKIDALGREYDYSEKPYYVLCRNGWVEPKYVYRHKTNKDIYLVEENEVKIEVTEDHSLFDEKQNKIKPSEITSTTKLEYYKGTVEPDYRSPLLSFSDAEHYALEVAEGGICTIPYPILNATQEEMKKFYDIFMESYKSDVEYSKSVIAGLKYIKNFIK